MENTMESYSLMLEDEKRMRFVKVEASDAVNALIEAMKKSGILDPLKVLRIGINGIPEKLIF